MFPEEWLISLYKIVDVIHLTERNQTSVINRLPSLLARGGVAAVPTDTVYGLIADIGRESAVRKIFRIKVRSHLKASPVFVRDIDMAREYAYADAKTARLLEELWPGQTTAVLRKRDATPDYVTGGARTVGLRIPDHPFLQTVLAEFPRPLIGTSANLSGSEPAGSATEVQQIFKRRIPRPDMLIDAGPLPPSPPSTVLDLTNPDNPKILRMGAITKAEMDKILSQWQKTD